VGIAPEQFVGDHEFLAQPHSPRQVLDEADPPDVEKVEPGRDAREFERLREAPEQISGPRPEDEKGEEECQGQPPTAPSHPRDRRDDQGREQD